MGGERPSRALEESREGTGYNGRIVKVVKMRELFANGARD